MNAEGLTPSGERHPDESRNLGCDVSHPRSVKLALRNIEC